MKFCWLKKDRGGEGNFKWNLVKGTYDDSRETIKDCIKREIKEEIGLNAKNFKLKKIFHYGDNDNLRILFVFSVNYISGDILIPPRKIQLLRNENINSFEWFNEKKISLVGKKDFMASYVYLSLKKMDEKKDDIEIIKI